MDLSSNKPRPEYGLTFVVGATGKTGSRVAEKLTTKGVPVRLGSRSATPSFDWLRESSWDSCLKDVENVYISYSGDLAVPDASDTIQAFTRKAKRHGVKRAVLLTGRGEDEALSSELALQNSGLTWTIVRAAWFNQNFLEGAFADLVEAGQITLPAGSTPEPFVDANDIADVAVAALTESGHSGQIYEVTGPRLMTFADVAFELSAAIGREIQFLDVPHDTFINAVEDSGAPHAVLWLLDYLFTTVLDGRNAYLADGVERALGRPPKDFSEFASEFAVSRLLGEVA